MKLPQNYSPARGASGILLIECMVYISVFAILLGGATTVFYFCWDHTQAVVYTTDEIASALHAGERWRSDVRASTGKINVESSADGEVVRIPKGARTVSYRFESGQVSRQVSGPGTPQVLLAKTKTSEMKLDVRGAVNAWRWEVQLLPRRKEANLPLLFTFEAVAPARP